jgi:hypothetical protein
MSVPPEPPEPFGQPGQYGHQPGDFGPQPEGSQPYEPAYEPPAAEPGPSSLPAGFPGQGGVSPYPPGERHHNTLPWVLGAGALVVVGVVLLVLFTSGAIGGAGNRSNPDAVAASVADSLTNRDDAEARSVACDGKSPVRSQVLLQLQSYQVTAKVKGKAQVFGTRSLATIHLTFRNDGHTLDLDSALNMELSDGQWCVPAAGLRPDSASMRIDGRRPGTLGPNGLPSGSPVTPPR